MTKQQHEALQYATALRSNSVFFTPKYMGFIADELERLHARVQELEAELAAAQQGLRATGYISPKGRYVPPVLFNPYSGEPRDARDIASDPRGVLIVPPGAALAAQAKQGEHANG